MEWTLSHCRWECFWNFTILILNNPVLLLDMTQIDSDSDYISTVTDFPEHINDILVVSSEAWVSIKIKIVECITVYQKIWNAQ